MKKFYKEAVAGTAPGGFVVRLDGKILKTPVRNNLIFQHQELANAIAAEWAGQGDNIEPQTMPLTQLVNTMIDKSGGAERHEMNAEVTRYGGSDLLCYLATHPPELVARQEKSWGFFLDWAKKEYDLAFETVKGIRYVNQPPETLKKIERIIKELDPAGFTVIQAATATLGSVVLALALNANAARPEEIAEAACIDEIYQLETWGEDAIARKRIDRIRDDMSAIARFRDLVRSTN